MKAPLIEETRPGHGIPADWLSPDNRISPGWWVKNGSQRHQRVEATHLDLSLRVRCHDCGLMAWHRYRKPVFAADGGLIYKDDPLAFALGRLDSEACEPLGAQPLFDLAGALMPRGHNRASG